MSVVLYGTELLNMCQIQDYEMRDVLSEDGVDYLYTQYRVKVQAVVSLDFESAGMTLDLLIKRIKRQLETPRQPLTVWVGERNATGNLEDNDHVRQGELLNVGAPDIHFGPICEIHSFHQFTGTRYAILNATFHAHENFCSSPREVLSNRWKSTYSIDQNRMTRMTLNGRLHVNSKIAAYADNYRLYAFIPAPAGFIITSSDFTVSTDGLILDWNVVYEEKYQLPPFPLTTLSAEYSESTTYGAITEAEMSMTAEAPKSVSKAAMITPLMLILVSRFNFEKDAKGQAADVLLAANVTEGMTENRLAVNVKVRKSGAGQQNAPNNNLWTPLDHRVFGIAIPGARERIADHPPHGTALRAAVHAAWRTACEGGGIVASRIVDPSTIASGNDPPFIYQYGILPAAEPNEISPGNTADPYKDYKSLVEYQTETGMFTLPLAQAISSGSSSGGDQTAMHVRLHQPYTTKRVRYSGERYNQWPEAPKPMTYLEGGEVARSSMEAESPDLGADLNNYVYQLSGTHEIVLDHHLDETTEEVVGGVSPAYKMTSADSAIPTGTFRDDLTEDPAA